MNNTRKSVLFLVYQDGWIEAFADKSVDVNIVNVPFVESVEGDGSRLLFISSRREWRKCRALANGIREEEKANVA